MPRLTTVTFDLWQTLILDTPELSAPRARLRHEGVLQVLRGEGLLFTRQQIVEGYRRCYALLDGIREKEGDIAFDEQIEVFLRSVDEGLPGRLSAEARAEIARRYADSYLAHPPQIDEHAHRVLRTLRRRGYRLALICNTGATPGVTQRVFLKRRGLAQHFEALVFSDEERLSKPAAEIFRVALERVGAAPAEAVHVGDHPRNDVEGAKRAGMAAIWLRRKPQEPAVAPDACIESLDQTLDAVDRLALRARSAAPPLP